jgi:hypothetical protein
MPVNPDTVALTVAALVFLSGLAGLFLRGWRHTRGVDETRDLINRVTGVIATLSALVLGLLIVSANNFYNTQKTGLETASARILQIDGMLRRFGPEAQQARDVLKDMFASKQTDSGTLKMPTIEETNASMDSLFAILNHLRESAPDERKYLIAKAEDLASSINEQRLQMSLQLSNSLTWPFMAILVSWACLLFFGLAMLAPVSRTTVAVMTVGALSLASAIFLIVELSNPYSGLFRLSPDPVLKTIEALSK